MLTKIGYKRAIFKTHNLFHVYDLYVLLKHLKKKSTQSIKGASFLILNKGANLNS